MSANGMDDDVGGELDRLDESDRLDRWSEGIGFVELPIRLVEIQAQACGESGTGLWRFRFGLWQT